MYARRWWIFSGLAIGFFAIAVSKDVYNITSPPDFSLHVLLRKVYSIIAFAIVGAAYVWASDASLPRTAIAIAVYSGAIECGQHFSYGLEPLYWNAIDVLCGAIGGALGALIPWVHVKPSARTSAARSPDRPRRA